MCTDCSQSDRNVCLSLPTILYLYNGSDVKTKCVMKNCLFVGVCLSVRLVLCLFVCLTVWFLVVIPSVWLSVFLSVFVRLSIRLTASVVEIALFAVQFIICLPVVRMYFNFDFDFISYTFLFIHWASLIMLISHHYEVTCPLVWFKITLIFT